MLKLQIRGIHGEHSESSEGIYDISNKARLGLTEYQAVKQMYDGVKELIEMEKMLERYDGQLQAIEIHYRWD